MNIFRLFFHEVPHPDVNDVSEVVESILQSFLYCVMDMSKKSSNCLVDSIKLSNFLAGS